MVKKEHIYPEPDSPPGFPLQHQTPHNWTSSTSLCLPTLTNTKTTQNKTDDDDPKEEFNGHAQRRTSRKRVKPQFYDPSPVVAAPGRGGATQKLRLVSQPFSHQQETRNDNQVSSAPSGRPQEEMPCLTTALQMSKDIDPNLIDILQAITKKHGDITKGCSLQSDSMKSLVVLGVCKVVRDLNDKKLKDLDMATLDSCYMAVRDAENMKVDVKWLLNRLDEIKDALKSDGEANVLVTEKDRLIANVSITRSEIQLREDEIRQLEDLLIRKVVRIEELKRRISFQTAKFSQFQETSLMFGLI